MKTQVTPIELFIADDHELMRQGFCRMLEQEPDLKVIGEAANGADLLNQLKHCTPDVVITDIQMPVMDGIEATRIITKNYPGIAVIAISVFTHEYHIIKMIVAGARGHLSKSVTRAELATAIRAVHHNGLYYGEPAGIKLSGMIARNFFDPHQKKMLVNLTPRETAVLRLICMQKSNRDISSLLALSQRTIEDFRSSLLAKTRSENMAGLVVFAIRYGIYDPELDSQYLAAIGNT